MNPELIGKKVYNQALKKTERLGIMRERQSRLAKKSRIKEHLTHANRIIAGAKEREYEKIGDALGEFMFYTSKDLFIQ